MLRVTFDGDTTTLALAHDDLYLIGFTNRSNHWHILKGESGLPGATELPFGANYGSLLGSGGHANLFKVPLGNQSAIHALRTLAGYHPAGTRKLEQAKDAIARFVMMISEAMRFRVFRLTFSGQQWNEETHITPLQAKYVVVWGDLSTLLVRWHRSGGRTWGGSEADAAKAGPKINNANEAWMVVDFLLRPLKEPPARRLLG
ncbi:hypothetical protein ACP4OV_013177 [Aristida adscensionis]